MTVWSRQDLSVPYSHTQWFAEDPGPLGDPNFPDFPALTTKWFVRIPDKTRLVNFFNLDHNFSNLPSFHYFPYPDWQGTIGIFADKSSIHTPDAGYHGGYQHSICGRRKRDELGRFTG